MPGNFHILEQDQFERILAEHNAEFNPENIRLAKRKGQNGQADGPACKKLKVLSSDIKEIAKLLEKYPAHISLDVGREVLVVAADGYLFLGNSSSQPVNMKEGMELFSFGAGDWLTGRRWRTRCNLFHTSNLAAHLFSVGICCLTMSDRR